MTATGKIVVAIIVTILTWGVGTAAVGTAGAAGAGTTTGAVTSTAATTAVTTEAVTAAVVQSVVTGVTNQLVTSAVTGESFKLDTKSLVLGAVSAGVMSYASGMIDTAMGLEGVPVNKMSYVDQFERGVANTVVKSGVDSALYGTDFGESLKMGLATDVSNVGFRFVGDTTYELGYEENNPFFKEGALGKVALHGLVGAGSAALMGEDASAGAASAAANELLGFVSKDFGHDGQLAVSGLIGAVAGGVVAGEEGVEVGQTIARSATEYNRLLHQDQIKWVENPKNIEDFQEFYKEITGQTIEDEKTAITILAKAAASKSDESYDDRLKDNSAVEVGKMFIDMSNSGSFAVPKEEYEARYMNLESLADNKEFYNEYLNLSNDQGNTDYYIQGLTKSTFETIQSVANDPSLIVDGAWQFANHPIDSLMSYGNDLAESYYRTELDYYLGDTKSAQQRIGAYLPEIAGIVVPSGYFGSKVFGTGTKSSISINGADSAKNVATFEKYKADLGYLETYQAKSSRFNSDGTLTYESLNKGTLIDNIDLSQSKNEVMKQELTKNGSNIEDWSKSKTKVDTSGKIETHYYQNQQTGDVNYNIDYKTVVDNNAKFDSDVPMTDDFREQMMNQGRIR